MNPDNNRSTTKPFDYRVLVIALAGLIVTLPCLIYGFPFYGDDSVWNAIYYSNFSSQFWSGDLIPHWLSELNGGLGNPTGYYYPPVAYWLTSLLRLVFRSDPYGWRQLGVSAAVAIIASGLAIYGWLKQSVGARAALISAVIYVVLPYHLNIDLFDRGALAELWAFVWMPLVLWSVDGLQRKSRFALVSLAVSYALLVMTHLPTTLVFSLLPPAYALLVADNRWRPLVMTIVGMLLGIGLSCIYLFPALTMQEFVFHTTEGIGRHYYFGNWFLFTGLSWSGRGSEYFYAAVSMLVLVVGSSIVLLASRATQSRRRMLFWFVVALICFVMMTPLSRLVWESVATLQKIQFPFRFGTVFSLAAAVVAGLTVSSLNDSSRTALVYQVALLVLSVVWIYTAERRAYYAYPAHYVDQGVINSVQKRLSVLRDTNEFRPRWVVSIEEPELDALLERIGKSDNKLRRVNVIRGNGSVAAERWTPGNIVLGVNAIDEVELNVSQFYFPGWMISVDNGAFKAAQPSKPGGLLNVTVPSGQHRVVLKLGKRRPEVAGEVVSLASLLIVLALMGFGLRRD